MRKMKTVSIVTQDFKLLEFYINYKDKLLTTLCFQAVQMILFKSSKTDKQHHSSSSMVLQAALCVRQTVALRFVRLKSAASYV